MKAPKVKKLLMIWSYFGLVGVMLSGCGGSTDSYGAACPILNVNATKMAMVIASVPTAADRDTKLESIKRALASAGETDLIELKLKFNSDMNIVLSGPLDPPTGSKFDLVETLRENVYKWSWTEVSEAEKSAIIAAFADIDAACNG